MASSEVTVDVGSDHVARVEIHRPPNNYFDARLIGELADSFEALDRDPAARVILLTSEGKHFCAGADLPGTGWERTGGSGGRAGAAAGAGGGGGRSGGPSPHLYDEAGRLFASRTPVVAAVQGAAVGGGLGLALMADFRVAAPEARFSANFARLGFHHGFALTVTLPRVVGEQRAAELLFTGRRISGDDAFAMGLCDRLVSLDRLYDEARELAAEIAQSGPLAVPSIRDTLRGDLADRAKAAMARERAEQDRLARTSDYSEGVRAMSERRLPEFTGS